MAWAGTVRTWDYPKSPSVLLCRGCGGRRGYTNLGSAEEWWVCNTCRRPTERWLRAQGDAVLNKFVGGPLDGMVYTSSSLLDDPRLANLVLGYTYANEVVKSELTQRTARVWHLSATVNTGTQSTQEGTTMTAQETAEPQAPAEPTPAPEPVNVEPIVARRKELKLSRTPVAAHAGITVAQLARIEGGGPRTTQAEADKVSQALDALAAQQPAQAAVAEGQTAATPDPA